jgi:hypothetical protein
VKFLAAALGADRGERLDLVVSGTERGAAGELVRAKDDGTHLILILQFASAEDADRVATEVGGPWMREHVLPLLARGPERSVGEFIASVTR